MNYFIDATSQQLERGLESWQWLPVAGKSPILVTAFGDVFLSDSEGVWFLDTLEGTLTKKFGNRAELDESLRTEAGQDWLLMAPLIDRAVAEGQVLSKGQCFDFKLHPCVGGHVAYENVERRDFVLALHLRGQLHDQTRHLQPGTIISGFVFESGG